MPKELTPEQFWKLYEKLPPELKDAIFAEETGDNIYGVCERNDVTDKLQDIVGLVSQILVGVLPAEDFQKSLEELKMEKETAKKVAQEINRFVFYPVKPALDQLYQMGTTTGKEEPSGAPKTGTEQIPAESPQEVAGEKKGPTGKDTYRESVE
jgi:hypothetical protein